MIDKVWFEMALEHQVDKRGIPQICRTHSQLTSLKPILTYPHKQNARQRGRKRGSEDRTRLLLEFENVKEGKSNYTHLQKSQWRAHRSHTGLGRTNPTTLKRLAIIWKANMKNLVWLVIVLKRPWISKFSLSRLIHEYMTSNVQCISSDGRLGLKFSQSLHCSTTWTQYELLGYFTYFKCHRITIEISKEAHWGWSPHLEESSISWSYWTPLLEGQKTVRSVSPRICSPHNMLVFYEWGSCVAHRCMMNMM